MYNESVKEFQFNIGSTSWAEPELEQIRNIGEKFINLLRAQRTS